MKTKHTAYYEVEEALGKRTCAICVLVKESVFSYLSSLAYESLNNPETREKLRATLGFCSYHGYQLAKIASNLGLAVLYLDLLDALKHRVAHAVRRGHPGRAECPACAIRLGAEERYTTTLVEHLGDPQLRSRIEASRGLCLPHLAIVCSKASQEDAGFLVDQELRHIDGLQAELREVIRKSDYRFNHEGWGDEKDAPGRAMFKVSGELGSVND